MVVAAVGYIYVKVFYGMRDRVFAPMPIPAWTKPAVVLQADIFEASHTYKVRGQDSYVTLIEAQNGKRRYFKLYTAT